MLIYNDLGSVGDGRDRSTRHLLLVELVWGFFRLMGGYDSVVIHDRRIDIG